MARKSRVKYTLTSNTATRRWAAVRSLLHSLVTAFPKRSLMDLNFTVVLGLFGGVSCIWVHFCVTRLNGRCFYLYRRYPKPRRTSALWQLASGRMVLSLTMGTKAPNFTASSRTSCAYFYLNLWDFVVELVTGFKVATLVSSGLAQLSLATRS